MGGLGIINPVQASFYQFSLSQTVTPLLVDHFTRQDHHLSPDVALAQQQARLKLKSTHCQELCEWANQLHESFPDDLKLAVTLAQEKGTSSWLTAIPIAENNFFFHKSAFCDALALRYGWQPVCLPVKCVCGLDFTVEHAMNCPRGGLPSHHHNEVHDFTPTLLSKVCSDVAVEPDLQLLSSESMHYPSAIVTDEALS